MQLNKPTNPVNPGVEGLQKGWPWMTPGAVEFLNDLYLKTATVVEIGAGGSTIFWANRCKKVYAFEENTEWADLLQETISKKRLTSKVKLFNQEFDDPDSIEDQIMILCPDTSKRCTNWNRTEILNRWMPKLAEESIIVLDNYKWDKVYPGIFDLEPLEFLDKYNLKNHKVIDFDFDGWMGEGTRIVIHEEYI